MGVRIHQAWKHGAALEVNQLGPISLELENFVVGADGDNPIPLDGNGLLD